MCRSFIVFYDNCGHIIKRTTPCPSRNCMPLGYVGTPPIIYSADGNCPTCQSDPDNPTIVGSLLLARRHFFYRRGARQELVRFQRSLYSEHFSARSPLPPPPPGYPILYTLDQRRQGVMLLIPIRVEQLPEDSRDCTICGGSLQSRPRHAREYGTEFPVRLPCHKDHVFGHRCIETWMDNKDTCPICRYRFTINRSANWGELPFTFTFFDGERRQANWDDPILADLQNEEADGVVDMTPEGFEVSEILDDV